MSEPATLRGVAIWIVTNPWAALGRRWNYKSALLSAVTRSQLFFYANLSAGSAAAWAAGSTEFWFRLITAGFYGALTQAFRGVQPERTGMLAAMVVLPLVCHSAELLVHWVRGTEELMRSIAASMAFTAVSTAFNVFAMRRGALTVGTGSRSLVRDLQVIPRLAVAFVVAGVHAGYAFIRTRSNPPEAL